MILCRSLLRVRWREFAGAGGNSSGALGLGPASGFPFFPDGVLSGSRFSMANIWWFSYFFPIDVFSCVCWNCLFLFVSVENPLWLGNIGREWYIYIHMYIYMYILCIYIYVYISILVSFFRFPFLAYQAEGLNQCRWLKPSTSGWSTMITSKKLFFGGFTGQTYVFWLVVWNIFYFP